MNCLAAARSIAVLSAVSAIAFAQSPVMTMDASGSAGNITLNAHYTTRQPLTPAITGSVLFEDTSYGNALLASAPLLMENAVSTLTASMGGIPSNALNGSKPIAADLDGDGKLDALYIDSAFHLVFLKGNGDGTFQSPVVDSTATLDGLDLTARDFNGDGKLDIAAITSTTPASIFLRLGNGNGSFQAPLTVATGLTQANPPAVLRVGDFNGDGKADLYSSPDSSAQNGGLYLGNGDGTFQTAVTVPSAAGPAGDFNGDGRTDLIGFDYTLLGKTDGTFQQVTSINANVMAAADFDGDGKLDAAGLISTCCDLLGPSSLAIYRGNGDGTFGTTIVYSAVPDPSYYTWNYGQMVVADLNGDGRPDITLVGTYFATRADAMTSQPNIIFATYFGKPDGSLFPLRFISPSQMDANPAAVAGDFNGDGSADLLDLPSPRGLSNPLTRIFLTATTTFNASVSNVLVAPAGTHLVRARYAGDASYAAATSSTQGVSGAAATTTLTLAVTPLITTLGNAVTATATLKPCVVADHSCDSDGIVFYDGTTLIATVSPVSGVATTSLSLSQGSHSITARFNGTSYLPAATSNVQAVTIGPANAISGSLALSATGSPSSYSLSAAFSVPLLGAAPTGNVSFKEGSTTLATATFGSPTPTLKERVGGTMVDGGYSSTALYAADFDGDGKQDLIYPSDGTSSIGFLRGNGDGTFTSVTKVFSTLLHFAVADFNNDGKLDVLVPNSSSFRLSLGDGHGLFPTSRTIADATGYHSPVLTGDFNGDGKQDFYNGESQNVFFGNGDGTFQSASATAIQGLLSGDFNQDGRADLLAPDGIYLGQTGGTFTKAAGPSSTAYGHAVLTADFNNDGKLDFFTSDNTLLLGNGDGTFQTPVTVDLYVPLSGPLAGSTYFTGDFNGDGKQDIGAGIEDGGGGGAPNFLVVSFGDGAGGFHQKVFLQTAESDSLPQHMPDFTGDGASDIAVFFPLTSSGFLSLFQTPTVYVATATGVSIPTAGDHAVVANYPGDATTYLGAASNTITLTGVLTPALTLASSINPSAAGSNVTFTATLSPYYTYDTYGHTTEGEMIHFYDGATLLGSSALSAGTALLTLNTLSPGTHSITAHFDGDDSFAAVTSAPLSQHVNTFAVALVWPAPTAITYGTALSATQLNAATSGSIAGTFAYTPAAGTVLAPGSHTLSTTFTPADTATYSAANTTTTLVVNKASPSVTVTQVTPATPGADVNASVTLQATVAAGYGTPSGTVSFYDGATLLGPGTLGAGTATLTTSFITVGSHAITAVYAGDSNFNTVTSAALGVTVSKITPPITWAAPAAIVYGTPLSATQLNATSTVAGTFAYTPAAGVILAAGSQTLSATLTPTDTATYNNATATRALTVSKAAPSIAITRTSPVTIGIGTGVSATLRATVTAAYGAPTGTVTFYDGSTALGSGTLAAGLASITTSFSTTGVHPITAVYAGDANFSSVTSPVFNETVVLVGLSFSATPNPITIKRGQTGTVTITGTPTGNYTGTSTFSCSGLPAFTSCSFAPTSLSFTGDNQAKSTVLTITTQTTNTAAVSAVSSIRFASLLGLPLLALALRRRRKLQQMLLLLLAAAVLLPALGCGSSSPSADAATGNADRHTDRHRKRGHIRLRWDGSVAEPHHQYRAVGLDDSGFSPFANRDEDPEAQAHALI